MARGRYSSEYERVRQKSALGRKPPEEFEGFDDVEEQRQRVEAMRVETIAKLQEVERIQNEQAKLRAAEFDKLRKEWTERFIRREYEHYGLTPPTPLMALSFYLHMGWTIESVSGLNTLVQPNGRRRPDRSSSDGEES